MPRIITFEIPDKIYGKNQKETERIVSEADEAFGHIDQSITCRQESQSDVDTDWAEMWLEDVAGDYDIHPEDHIVKDANTLKEITDRIWKTVYNENGYGMLSCSFVNVEHLLVLDISGIYLVHIYVEHGVNDGDEGCTKHCNTFDFKMKRNEKGKLEYYKE